MEGDISGVRITPPILEFYNTAPGEVFQITVNVKNISKTSKSIRYYGPKDDKFILKVKNPEKPIAPGLCVQALLEYEPTAKEEVKDRLVVTVDGDVIEVPINAYPSQPELEFGKEVNFGNIVATSRVIGIEIPLVNHGSESGQFKLQYSGSKHLSAHPSSGTVPPQSVQVIKIECVTKEPGKLNETFTVDLEGQESSVFKVYGNIVKRSLQLLSINNEQPLDCVKFGSTYYGTDKTEYAILFNDGPETINYVSIMDEEAEAQELGVDLSQTTAAALATETNKEKVKGRTNELTSLITAIPNQGVLRPYEKIPIFFRFSPRWYSSKQGWKCQIAPPPRKDFALFMRLQIIGSNNSMSGSEGSGSSLEVALTGTALPVLLDISPAPMFDFGECLVGEHTDVLFTLKNESNILPINFTFQRIAHFSSRPPNGKITPGQTQDVIFSFSPRQVGTFTPQQLVHVLGHLADNRNPTLTHLEIIHTMGIKFKGTSDPVVIKPSPRFNPGITPLISNEVGMYTDDTTFVKLDSNKPRNALVSANKTRLHSIKSASSSQDNDSTVKIAYPNDRAQSIRPTDKRERYQTIFTKSERHHYIDPDYAYTDEEEEQIRQHTERYLNYIQNLRENRLNKKKQSEFAKTNNSVDIGLKSAGGLRPFTVKINQMKDDPKTPSQPNASWKLLSAKELTEIDRTAQMRPISEGLNALPNTLEEKKDCSKWLTPQQLHQLSIGPATLDFGKVCLRSVSQKNITIVNNLNQYVHVVAEIDCKELRQSSPLSQVIPPVSKAVIPVIFESSVKGTFQRSVSYTVNGFHRDHVTVLADVVPVSLELSTHNLVVKPMIGTPADAGIRGVITLYNKYNYHAEFKWVPQIGEKGTAFSIRPAAGTVKAFQSLDCEVVWHPSYMAPLDGEFSLEVFGGTTTELHCSTELGNSNVHFVDRRIAFGQVPVNLTTVKTALLKNTGPNHAFFQVLDPNPFPGLTVSPVHGVVPVGGTAEIKVALTPDSVLKFDTRIQLSIKSGKCIDLRMGGTVEAPVVDIDVPSFHLGGVYCGSGTQVPFKLINKTVTKAKVEFDLTRYKDFSLDFPGKTVDEFEYEFMNPGMYCVSLRPLEVIEGELRFIPRDVAAYDFIMPVVINHLGAPSPAPTPFPPTPVPSQKNSLEHIINPRPKPVTVNTPRKHVVATALRQPLQLSTNIIDFTLSSNFHDVTMNTGFGGSKNVILVNNSDKLLKWALDLSNPSKSLDKGILKFLHPTGLPFMKSGSGSGIEGELEPGKTQSIVVLFCPDSPGIYEAVVPIIINEEWEKPYQYLKIRGELKAPKIWFQPSTLCLTPVPLLTEISEEFSILASQYKKVTPLTVELPEVECEDGSTISPLEISFSQGKDIDPCCGDSGQMDPCSLRCKVTFISSKPISFCKPIIFKDTDGRKFSIMITATADNCILSCYPFLALHRTDHQIVCEQGSAPKGQTVEGSNMSDSVGEAIIVPCQTPTRSHSRQSTSATSSTFHMSSSSYQSSVDCTDGTEGTTPLNREGAMNKHNMSIEQTLQVMRSRSVGSAMFPDEDTEEGVYHTEVLMAIQRWFSSNGWPSGTFPIQIPQTLRKMICKKQEEDKSMKLGGGSETTSVKKDVKTIYDMISHLSGRPVPGIPLNTSLPAHPEERVKQIYWQHKTLLTFIRCQGGSVSGIKPEHLMEFSDYLLWKQITAQMRHGLMMEGKNEEAEKIIISETVDDVEMFEALSKRSWTDLLLQIMKCLVLAKVTPRTLKNIATPMPGVVMPLVNPDPLCSNIYGVGERIILTWLNHHYEQYRHVIWKNSDKGGIPASRWIVNYDMDLLDGLVVGCVLGAHLPFLVSDYLNDMYTHPTTAEQCLHNALKIVNAMRFAGIEYDIQAIDITDPNPISMLLLCMHLYQKLPQYLPKDDIDFTGTLHATVTRQVKLTNSSSKSLSYHALIAGRDARDFHLPKGDHVTVPPKSTYPLPVEYVSRFLRPADAVLVLVGRRHGSSTGITMTFHLHTQIDNVTPLPAGNYQKTVKIESPCYELERITLDVTNPFNEAGEFKIILVESSKDQTDMSTSTATSLLLRSKEKKKKRIKSRTDHGQHRADTPPTPPPPVITNTEELSTEKKTEESATLSAFSSPMKTFYLGAGDSADVQIDFLPFFTGERQCSVIFLNEKIGEFLYCIEATATLPLPSALPFLPTQNTVRVSSAAPVGNGRTGLMGGEQTILYLKCELNQTLNQNLIVPVTNMAKERALILASQQRMTDLEIQRRNTTGTLTSSSVAAKTVKLLSSGSLMFGKSKKCKNHLNKYTVEVDSEYFRVPPNLTMPSPLDARSHSAPTSTRIPQGVQIEDGIVELPITFKASSPGHYPAQIVLRSPDDVRVYNIECTVNPEGSMAELELTIPVNQTLKQNIPIVNMSNHDWPLRAEITGDGFSGPTSHLAKAYQTAQYPLMFKPLHESTVKGKLVLVNTQDGTEHVFVLNGKPEKPLALDHIKIDCEAKKSLKYSIKVPNATKKKQTYYVESDLHFTSGAESITVLANQTGSYNLMVSPDQRGHFKGVVAFTAAKRPPVEVDSDGDEVPSNPDDSVYDGYRIWYSIEINVAPPPPERSLDIICSCRKKTLLDVIVRNPTVQDIVLQTTILGRDLEGPASLVLPGGEKDVYTLTYAPSQVGQFKSSLIFYHPAVGEFWYELNCTAEPPAPTVLPHVECELGRWTKLMIHLDNPTDESLDLVPFVSNMNNFSLEVDNDRALYLRARSSLDVPLHFMPSTLGNTSHTTKVSFNSKQFGEWVFEASGTGLGPSPQDPVSVFTPVGSNTTLIIPFRNPTDHFVVAEVLLTVSEEDVQVLSLERINDSLENEDSPFCLLLKHNAGIRIPPKATLDIPISFAPTQMKQYQSLCTIVVKRDDGEDWEFVPNSQSGEPVVLNSEALPKIKWLFPIHGIPESHPVRDSQAAVIECQARETIQQRLEVALSGVAPSSAGAHKGMKTRAVTPKNKRPTLPDGIVVGETLATTNEFTFNIAFDQSVEHKALKDSIDMSLVRQYRDMDTGLVVLLFNVVFNPFKPLRCDVQLCVQAATGGLWKFPLKFKSTEPPADDVIQIEATGLNKSSSVGFYLNSQTMQPVPFNAFFTSGSDQEFTVTPQTGELLPTDTEGTKFVINLLPGVYGKVYTAKLIIQTPDMQWSYNIRGVLPEYSPPRGSSSKPIKGPHPDPRIRGKPVNYIQENLHLLTTAVSSPIKGSKLVLPRVV